MYHFGNNDLEAFLLFKNLIMIYVNEIRASLSFAVTYQILFLISTSVKTSSFSFASDKQDNEERDFKNLF